MPTKKTYEQGLQDGADQECERTEVRVVGRRQSW